MTRKEITDLVVSKGKTAKRFRGEAFYALFSSNEKGIVAEFLKHFKLVCHLKLSQKKIVFCHAFEYRPEDNSFFLPDKVYYHLVFCCEGIQEISSPALMFSSFKEVGLTNILYKRVTPSEAIAFSFFISENLDKTAHVFSGTRKVDISPFIK